MAGPLTVQELDYVVGMHEGRAMNVRRVIVGRYACPSKAILKLRSSDLAKTWIVSRPPESEMPA